MTATPWLVLLALDPLLPGAGLPLPASDPAPRGHPGQGAPSPTGELRRSTEALRRVLQRRLPRWSPESEAQTVAVRRIVDELLDFDEIARRTLGRQWKMVSSVERTEFVELLQQIIERRPLDHGMPVDGKSTIAYEREIVADGEALVESVITVNDPGRSTRRRVDYKLSLRERRWHVYDIVIDGASLVDGYRQQFTRIIAEDSFEGLLRRMRKKVGSDHD